MEESEIAHMTGLVDSEASRLYDFLAGLGRDEWLRPSACAGWTVGDVVAHLTQSADTWSEGIARAKAGDSSPPPGQQALRPGERGSEVTAQRAIDLRRDKAQAELLRDFAGGYVRLGKVLRELRPGDWGKTCFHRRGALPVRDYVGLRVQELTIHGWDIRSAFDDSAEPSEEPFGVLLSMVPRWLTNTFNPALAPAQSIRYRFDVSGPLPVHQDVVVEAGSFKTEPATSPTQADADVTFRCNTGNYLLLIYGRLDLGKVVDAGRLAIEGDRALAARFNDLFQGV